MDKISVTKIVKAKAMAMASAVGGNFKELTQKKLNYEIDFNFIADFIFKLRLLFTIKTFESG